MVGSFAPSLGEIAARDLIWVNEVVLVNTAPPGHRFLDHIASSMGRIELIRDLLLSIRNPRT